jgi:hypothetical protein
MSGQFHAPAALSPVPIGGLVGPRAGLDDVEKRKILSLLGLELRPLGHPARSQSLCRLSSPGSLSSNESNVVLINLYLFKSDNTEI